MTSIKDKFKAALLTIHEQPLDYPEWDLTGALLREFTARERQYAQEAVSAEAGEADPDQVLFRAMLVQRCLTDPETGRPYADGRTNPSTGEPSIDPRTRTPIFTIEDIQDLADSRAIIFNKIWDDLLTLAALGPQAMFSSGAQDVGGERDAGAGAAGTGDAAVEDEGARPSDVDGGAQVDSKPKRKARNTA